MCEPQNKINPPPLLVQESNGEIVERSRDWLDGYLVGVKQTRGAYKFWWFMVGALIAAAVVLVAPRSAWGQDAPLDRPPAIVFLTVGDEAGWKPGNWGIGQLAEALRERGHAEVWREWREQWAFMLRPGHDAIFVHNPAGFAYPGRGMRVDQLLALPGWLQDEVVGLVGDMRADGHRVIVYLGHPAPDDERVSIERLAQSVEPFTRLGCEIGLDAVGGAWAPGRNPDSYSRRLDGRAGAFVTMLRTQGVAVLPETNNRAEPCIIDSNWLAGEDAQGMPVSPGSVILPYPPSAPADDAWRDWWPGWWRSLAERGLVASIRPWWFTADEVSFDEVWRASEPNPTPVALLLGIPESTPFGTIDGAASAVGGIDRVEIDGAVVPLTHGCAFEWSDDPGGGERRAVRIDAWGNRGGHATATVTINDSGGWLVVDASDPSFDRRQRIDTGGRGLWLHDADLDGPVRSRLGVNNTAPIVLERVRSDGDFGNLAEPGYWRGGIYIRDSAFRGGVVVAPSAKAWVRSTLSDMLSEGFHGASLVLDCAVAGIRKPAGTTHHPDLIQVNPDFIGDFIACGLTARSIFGQGVFTRAASGEAFRSMHLIAVDVDQRAYASQLLRSCADLVIRDCRFTNSAGEARPFYIANDAHPTRFERVEVEGLEAPGFKCDPGIVPIDVWIRRTLDDGRVVIDGEWEAAR